MRYDVASEASVLAVAGGEISEAVNGRVIALFRALQESPPEWLENLHPAYASLLVDFDPRRVEPAAVVSYLAGLELSSRAEEPSKLVELRAVYDGEDVSEVARIHGLTIENLIQLHSSVDYRVAFLGFMPGFAYLMGLPAALETPRRAVPRLRVPGGSIAIGGGQTGVYPADSPGGWQVIGRVVERAAPFPADWVTPGDRVRFVTA